ncbi:Uncharacterised protein [uncultured archaeon]|nr:Uncharacterised protein [uncultured archaeon]
MESSEIIKSINSIYKKYHSPQNLARHMKQVAAVAALICDNSKIKVDKENIVAAAIIHDLGQFIKMKLDGENICLLDLADQAKIDFFKETKKEFIAKYGSDDNIANTKIAREIGAPKKVIELLESKEVKAFAKNWNKKFEERIILYADMRCSPHGVVSLEERLAEGNKRYNLNRDEAHKEFSRKFTVAMKEIEKELFEKLTILPEDINSNSVKKYLDEWK